MVVSRDEIRKTGANTGFASGGVTCKLGDLCFVSSSVLVDSFVLRNPPERKARKRWRACKMKQIDEHLPDWIHKQATLGPNIEVEGELNDDNFFWYLLTLSCPLIFESYAIVLHPFWVNWKAKELLDSGLKLTENQVLQEDFKRTSWKDFFAQFNEKFELKTANKNQLDILEKLNRDDWPVHIWYPSEGNCETDELNFIFSKIHDLYGDELVNYYYCLLKTEKWEEEKIYQGKISEFEKLKSIKDLTDNPTAIYPENEKWSIVTDYDSMFTYIGGSKELVKRITKQTDFEIFELKPIFKEKGKKNTTRQQ